MSIKEIIEEQFGFKTQDDFDRYYHELLSEERHVTDEEFDRLNPDKIDNIEFWEYLDEHFDRAICGGVSRNHGKLESANRTEEALKMNAVLTLQSGVLNYFNASSLAMSPRDFDIHILEIGVGLGSGKILLDGKQHVKYTGIDVVPRVEGVIQTNGNGLPPELKKRKFHHVFSSNVFQHLSKKQRLQYYDDIYNVLPDNGYFSLALQLFTPQSTIRYVNINGTPHICHYGQFTPIQTFDDVFHDITKDGLFGMLHSSGRWDGFSTLTFIKRQTEGKTSG
jgi:hypothetical protein